MTRIALVAALAVAAVGRAEPAPLVEKYLHSGELAVGERAVQRALDAAPTDDQLRFGLGVLRFVRAVERFGQSMYEHGVKSESTSVPFLRIPVPKNPDPTPITYPILRRIFEQLTDDLAKAETTLAGVKDDNVKLPLRLAKVRFDFVGGGKETTTLLNVLKTLMRQQRFEFLENNPDFLVKFDRGDVAWLRGYCHLLSAMADAYLSIDGKWLFDEVGADHFARPKGQEQTPGFLAVLVGGGIKFPEPGRMHSFRKHMLAVCELNRETWRHVRAEKDSDFEWLPNAKQKGVLGLPVRDEMIDGWLAAVAELEGLLTGKKLFELRGLSGVAADQGFNLRAFLDDPPAVLDVAKIIGGKGVDPKYLAELTEKNRYDDGSLGRVLGLFGDSMGVAYMAWFN